MPTTTRSPDEGARRGLLEPFEPTHLGPLQLRNRIIRTAAFEGMSPGGKPTDELLEHHRAIAAGGAALTTVAYCSPSTDGRTYDHQLLMIPDIVGALSRLTDEVHQEGAAASIQLGHAGYFANRAAIGGRPIGPSRLWNTYGRSLCRAMNEDDIQRVVDDFATAARRAREAGFDALEIHAGHGYLLSQFISPYTNRRRDRWGGDLDGRMRLPLQVLEQVRDAAGPDLAVVVKINMEDGFSEGLQLDEAVETAKRFEAAGADGLVLSGGFVTKTPFYMLRGKLPVREMAAVQQGWINRTGLTLFGRLMVPEHPFEEMFFLKPARRIRQAVTLPLVLVGGVTHRRHLDRAMAEGFDLVALGRALIMNPALVNQWARGETDGADCDHCNRCVAEMDRGGVRCTTLLERQR